MYFLELSRFASHDVPQNLLTAWTLLSWKSYVIFWKHAVINCSGRISTEILTFSSLWFTVFLCKSRCLCEAHPFQLRLSVHIYTSKLNVPVAVFCSEIKWHGPAQTRTVGISLRCGAASTALAPEVWGLFRRPWCGLGEDPARVS